MKGSRPIIKPLVALVLEAIIAIELLFPAWLGADIVLYRGSASLWQINRMIKNLTEYAYDTDSDLSMIPYIIYIVLGVALLTVVCTFLSIYRAFTKSSPVEATGFIGPVILSAIVLVIVWFTNAAVRSETDGWIDSIIFVESAPIVVLILGIIGILTCNKVPDSVFVSIDQKLRSMSSAVSATTKEVGKNTAEVVRHKGLLKIRKCPSCGVLCNDSSALFCPCCGAELSPVIRCSSCGKDLSPGAKFCPYCGKATPNSQPAADGLQHDSVQNVMPHITPDNDTYEGHERTPSE